MPPDITMCGGEGCPIRNACYRFRAVPAGRQDWFGNAPYDPATATCRSFWDLASLAATDEQIRTRAYYLWVARGRPEGASTDDWDAARAASDADLSARLRPPR